MNININQKEHEMIIDALTEYFHFLKETANNDRVVKEVKALRDDLRAIKFRRAID